MARPRPYITLSSLFFSFVFLVTAKRASHSSEASAKSMPIDASYLWKINLFIFCAPKKEIQRHDVANGIRYFVDCVFCFCFLSFSPSSLRIVRRASVSWPVIISQPVQCVLSHCALFFPTRRSAHRHSVNVICVCCVRCEWLWYDLRIESIFSHVGSSVVRIHVIHASRTFLQFHCVLTMSAARDIFLLFFSLSPFLMADVVVVVRSFFVSKLVRTCLLLTNVRHCLAQLMIFVSKGKLNAWCLLARRKQVAWIGLLCTSHHSDALHFRFSVIIVSCHFSFLLCFFSRCLSLMPSIVWHFTLNTFIGQSFDCWRWLLVTAYDEFR